MPLLDLVKQAKNIYEVMENSRLIGISSKLDEFTKIIKKHEANKSSERALARDIQAAYDSKKFNATPARIDTLFATLNQAALVNLGTINATAAEKDLSTLSMQLKNEFEGTDVFINNTKFYIVQETLRQMLEKVKVEKLAASAEKSALRMQQNSMSRQAENDIATLLDLLKAARGDQRDAIQSIQAEAASVIEYLNLNYQQHLFVTGRIYQSNSADLEAEITNQHNEILDNEETYSKRLNCLVDNLTQKSYELKLLKQDAELTNQVYQNVVMMQEELLSENAEAMDVHSDEISDLMNLLKQAYTDLDTAREQTNSLRQNMTELMSATKKMDLKHNTSVDYTLTTARAHAKTQRFRFGLANQRIQELSKNLESTSDAAIAAKIDLAQRDGKITILSQQLTKLMTSAAKDQEELTEVHKALSSEKDNVAKLSSELGKKKVLQTQYENLAKELTREKAEHAVTAQHMRFFKSVAEMPDKKPANTQNHTHKRRKG